MTKLTIKMTAVGLCVASLVACAPQGGSTIAEATAAIAPHTDATLPIKTGSTPALGVSDDLGVELPGTDVRVTPEELADDVTVSGNVAIGGAEDNDSSTVAITSEAAVQMLTVINGPQDPESYSYDVDVPQGGSIRLGEDGSAMILDAAGDLLVAVPAPWAKDAEGNSVPTHFVVDGNQLTQVIQHTGADVAYPVVADPFWIPAWVLRSCGIGFLGAGAGYWVEGGRSVWTFIRTGAVGCVFGIIGKRF